MNAVESWMRLFAPEYVTIIMIVLCWRCGFLAWYELIAVLVHSNAKISSHSTTNKQCHSQNSHIPYCAWNLCRKYTKLSTVSFSFYLCSFCRSRKTIPLVSYSMLSHKSIPRHSKTHSVYKFDKSRILMVELLFMDFVSQRKIKLGEISKSNFDLTFNGMWVDFLKFRNEN